MTPFINHVLEKQMLDISHNPTYHLVLAPSREQLKIENAKLKEENRNLKLEVLKLKIAMKNALSIVGMKKI